MDQIVANNALFKPLAERYTASLEPRLARRAVLARPGDRGFRFARAASVVARAGQRLAVVVRRVGQPADTYTGPMMPAPEDVRARYQAGIFGVTETPPSLWDANRRW